MNGNVMNTKMINWNQIKIHFQNDGSLRDIIINNSNVIKWNIFLEKINSSGYDLEFHHDNRIIDTPSKLSDIKELQLSNPTTLKISINKSITINCHFSIDSEIEFDLSPREINSENDYLTLFRFLEWLKETLTSRVSLTEENDSSKIILVL